MLTRFFKSDIFHKFSDTLQFNFNSHAKSMSWQRVLEEFDFLKSILNISLKTNRKVRGNTSEWPRNYGHLLSNPTTDN